MHVIKKKWGLLFLNDYYWHVEELHVSNKVIEWENINVRGIVKGIYQKEGTLERHSLIFWQVTSTALLFFISVKLRWDEHVVCTWQPCFTVSLCKCTHTCTHAHTHTHTLTLSAACLIPAPSGKNIQSRDCVGASAGLSEPAEPAAGNCSLPLFRDHISCSAGTVSWLAVWIPWPFVNIPFGVCVGRVSDCRPSGGMLFIRLVNMVLVIW